MRSPWILLSISCMALGSAAARGQARLEFFGPHIPGNNIVPLGISGDGLVVYGISGLPGGAHAAFRWTLAEGMELLWEGWPLDASHHGDVLVGFAGASPWHNPVGVRWKRQTGAVEIGGREARGVSADGSVVVGWWGSLMHPMYGEAFRWTEESGMKELPRLPGGTRIYAYDISADGGVIAGYGNSTNFAIESFLWTPSTGTAPLGVAPGTDESLAVAISGDGQTVVGIGDLLIVGYRSTPWTGWVPIDPRPGVTTRPIGISHDGSVIVGMMWWRESSPLVGGAMIWTEEGGARLLQDELLQRYGLSPPPGWTMDFATGVSAQGDVITGVCLDEHYQRHAFVAILPQTPCYPNCDGSITPALNVHDFSCYMHRFAEGDLYANCDRSTTPPVLNTADFSCFLFRFAEGCR